MNIIPNKHDKLPKILNQHQVNVQILKSDYSKYSDYDILSISGRYRDEDYEIYKEKTRQFNNSVNEYRKFNEEALRSNVFKSDVEGDLLLKCEFLYKVDEVIREEYVPGKMTRKRTCRPVCDEMENIYDVPLTLEPWLKRFITLKRFIRVARTVIIYNRLVKVLAKLKSLDASQIQAAETSKCNIFNVSYPTLFEKFLDERTSV